MRHIRHNIRHLIGIGIVILGGLFGFYTILSQRGIFPSFWNITIGAILAVGTFIVGTLLNIYAPGPGHFSARTLKILYALAIIVDVVLLIVPWFVPMPVTPKPQPTVYCSHIQQGQDFPPSSVKNGIGVTQTNDGQFIGISDGSFAFDTGTASNDRPDTEKKCQAASQLANGDKLGAQQSWNDALQQETNDAEELIYQENQNILTSGKPYVTVVVATMLTGSNQGDIGVGRDTLQGVYTAQHENNFLNTGYTLPNNYKIRILIANAGNQSTNVTQVTQQIIQLAHADKTFVGVVGWNFSSYAAIEIPLLDQAKIPMILPTASEDKLLALSPAHYAFRITPTSYKEAATGVNYIQNVLKSKRVLLFTDYNDPFSGNLAIDFAKVYGGKNIIYTQTYRVGNHATLQGILAPLLLRYSPDLIYFAGYPDDLITLLDQLPPNTPDTLKVIGGDSLYEVGVHYPPNIYKRLLFTAAASPNVWQAKNLPPPAFYGDYAQNFDPHHHNLGIYGLDKADADAILSYDALQALLRGYANAASASNGQPPTLHDIEQGLNNVTSFQGASGLISLQDDDGTDPSLVNKMIVMLTVDANSHTQVQQVYGCLTQDNCY